MIFWIIKVIRSVVGKPVGGDLRQGLFTLPFLYYIGMENNDPDINKLIEWRLPI